MDESWAVWMHLKREMFSLNPFIYFSLCSDGQNKEKEALKVSEECSFAKY